MKNENLNELIKVKKIKKENNDLKNNLKLYKKIKRAIIEICSKIELNLNYIYNETNEKSKNIKNSKIFYTIEKNNYIELIKEYKEKINNSQEEINIVMRLNNIDLLDNEINKKEKISDNLKFENAFLNKINRKQIKNIYVLDSKKNKREDIMQLNKKIINLKEEIKLKKEFLQIYQLKIKKQRVKIEKIEKNCKLINENITYQKKKESEELEELYDEKRFLENKNVEDLNKDYKNKQKTFNLEEKKFQNLIKDQQILKSQLKSEIDLLYSEIIETEKNLKISEKEYNNSLIRKNQELKTILSYDNNNNQNTYNPFNVNNKLSTIPFNIKPCLNKNKLNLSLRINNNNNNRNSFQNILRNKSINDIYTNKNYEKI